MIMTKTNESMIIMKKYINFGQLLISTIPKIFREVIQIYINFIQSFI